MADRKNILDVKLNDENFMAIIRDFPGVYDRNSEDFKDKLRKEESWEKISDVLSIRIEDVKRRYETIRTRLSRYLKKAKEGYWATEITTDPKLDYLSWLVPHIKTRDNNSFSILSSSDIKVDSAEEDESAGTESIHVGEPSTACFNNEDPETRITMIQIAETNNNVTQSQQLEEREDGRQTMASVSSAASSTADFNRKRKYQHILPNYRTRDDVVEYRRNSDRQNVTPSSSSNGGTTSSHFDEDEHYCMSLVRRFKRLDSKKKAYLRSTIEKMFLDFELGYVQFPKQPTENTGGSSVHNNSYNH